jgi:hypothetical protein
MGFAFTSARVAEPISPPGYIRSAAMLCEFRDTQSWVADTFGGRAIRE